MATAALAYNAIPPTQRVFCSGTFLLPNVSHKYRCWKRHGHGALDLEEAITHSCDVYFYTVAQALGIDRIDDMLGQFGFGTMTGVDMPTEKNGLLPSRSWKQRIHHQVWFPGETIITGIGQGYWQVTPMQLAQAVARIAMRGAGFKPHLVHAMENPATHQMQAVEPEPLPPVKGVTPGMFDHVINGMRDVISQQGGTAYPTFHDATYTAAGKTGSAQVAGLSQEDEDAPKGQTLPLRLRDHALFIAFAPIENPQIAIAVISEHGIHPNWSAAPVARQIMDQWLLGKVTYVPTAGNSAPGTFIAPSATPVPTPTETPSDNDDDADPDENAQ
jgi:penicillin-binding protein 2